MDIVRKIGVIFGLVCLTFFASSSFAFTQTPESGWWWNPDENGRGYNIEVQDHFIYLSAYVYDDVKTDGVRRPVWFTAGGTLKGEGLGTFEGTLRFLEDGQCFGCKYSLPTPNTAENKTVKIEFTSTMTAKLTVAGETIEIERLHFADTYKNPASHVLGSWDLVMNTPVGEPLISAVPIKAKRLVFNDSYQDEVGLWIEGCSTKDILEAFCSAKNQKDHSYLGLYIEDFDEFMVAGDEGGNRYWYRFKFQTEKAWGLVLRRFSSAGPPQDADWNTKGTVVRAYRSASQQFVVKGEGPHKSGVEETAETNAESFLPPVKRNRKAALDLTEEERQAAFEETAEKLLDKLAQRELQ